MLMAPAASTKVFARTVTVRPAGRSVDGSEDVGPRLRHAAAVPDESRHAAIGEYLRALRRRVGEIRQVHRLLGVDRASQGRTSLKAMQLETLRGRSSNP